MTRYLLAGAAALALTTSAAFAPIFAQGLYSGTTTSQTTTTTTTPPQVLAVPVTPQVVPTPIAPAPGSYNASKTERTIEGNGAVVDHTQSYQSGAGGTAAKTTTHVTAPDGSQSSSWREEWTGAPSTTTTTKQTTTTTQ
jgi:hypothetical protein